MASDYAARLGGARSSLAFKAPCRVTTTASIALFGIQVIDGVTLAAEDRVLVKDQVTAAENGIWVCKALAWERARDFDGSADVVKGTRVFVHSGSEGIGEYEITTADPITIGVSSIAIGRSSVNALYPFLQSGTGAVTRIWQDKARDVVSVLDFIPTTLHAAIKDGTTTTPVVSYIQAALNAHSAVWLPRGTYLLGGTELATALNMNTGQRFFGPGILKQTGTVGYKAEFIKCDGVSDVVIDGIGMQQSSTANWGVTIRTSSDVEVVNCYTVTGSNVHGVFVFKNSSRVMIHNNRFSGGGAGVATGGDWVIAVEATGQRGTTGITGGDGPVRNVIIANNRISNTRAEAIDINWDTHEFIIAGNVGENICTQDSSGNEMIDIGGQTQSNGVCTNGLVIGNIMYANASHVNFPVGGITVKPSRNVRVIDNLFYGNGNGGVSVGCHVPGSVDVEIAENMFIGFDRAMYYSTEATRINCRDNQFLDVGEWGLLALNSGVYSDLTIEGNTFRGLSSTTNGIELRDVTTAVIRGNRVSGFNATTSGNGRGILVQSDCVGVTIDDNDVTGCTAGIVTLAAGTTIRNNRAWLNGGIGIWLAPATDCIVTSNQAWNNSQTPGSFGITIAAGSDRLVMVGNSVYDNQGSPTQRGISFGICDKCVVVGNNVPTFLTSSISGLASLTNSVIEANSVPTVRAIADGGTGATTARAAAANLSAGFILAQSAAAVSHTGDTNETTLATITVPANAMGPNGHIVVVADWTVPNSANNKVIRLRWNGTSGTQMSAVTLTTSATFRSWSKVANRNSASSQLIERTATTSNPFGSASVAWQTASANTTAAVTIPLQCQLANSSETITLESYAAYLYYGA